MDTSQLYLIFILPDGITPAGEFAYTFMFSETPETIWGEKWHICPAGVVPKIVPNLEGISGFARITTSVKLSLAQNSACFSMQDCIDGIIPLGYYDDEESDSAVLFPFGQKYTETKDNITRKGWTMADIVFNTESTNRADDLLDNLIDKL